jgi:A/G-specific adenine glycosylase
MTAPAPHTDAKKLTPKAVEDFRQEICAYYADHRRSFAWRDATEPYRILVSEIMLQQTQVGRVSQKYESFLERFPDFQALSRASLRDVLAEWLGLGYNRRAMSLHRTAQRVVAEFEGNLPDSAETLQTFPGIGKATAGALMAFAFRQPAVFIETNIRRVFLHFFFGAANEVKDSEILPLVEQTLDKARVRDWYYALMDYGAMLKTLEHNPNRRSAHYHVQAPFRDSDRQIRGLILSVLLKHPVLAEDRLVHLVGKDETRTRRIIESLADEGFLKRDRNLVRLTS